MKDSLEVRIGRYLSGEMTTLEKEAFDQEVVSNPDLKEQFLSLQRIWQNIPENAEIHWDTQSAWNRFSESVIKVDHKKAILNRRLIYWAAAATIIVLLGTYSIFFKNGPTITYAYQEGNSTPVELKDGSKVYLNKSSEITVYPFSRKKRHLELHGEAFFEISPDPKRPFFISSGETTTEVVGTSFNIKQTPDKTIIFVQSGKVIFSSSNDPKLAIALREGEAAFFEDQNMQMIPNPSPNINAWRTNQLKFINMPLSEVITDISAFFGKEITIENNAIKSCRITRTLPKKSELSAVLKSISLSINAKLVIEGDKYIIRGGGCS